MLVFADDAFASIAFLTDDVAENAALFFVVIMPTVVDFFADAARHDGQSNELRVRVLDGSARSFAVILEDEDVTEALIVLEVQHAVAVGPQHIFHGARGKRRERGGQLRSFLSNLVRADAAHFVEYA